MFGLSYGETIVLLAGAAALFGKKDLQRFARTGGRLVGRSIGYIQVFRSEIDTIMKNSQYHQVNKEFQDTLAQLEAIRYEIRGISMMNPGPMTRIMENPAETNINTGNTIKAGPSTSSEESIKASAQQGQHQQNQHQKIQQTDTSVFQKYSSSSMTAGSSDLHSQATAYARLAEAQAGVAEGGASMGTIPGTLSVFPISAESAGMLPKRQGEATGSDIVLEAVLEAEVARSAKEYYSKP